MIEHKLSQKKKLEKCKKGGCVPQDSLYQTLALSIQQNWYPILIFFQQELRINCFLRVMLRMQLYTLKTKVHPNDS
jgi:hypothetical protein